MSALSCFESELNRWPPPGGRHPHVMRLCNLGILAGMTDADIVPRIKAAMPRLPSPASEVESALRKARSTVTPGAGGAGGGLGGSSALSSSWSPSPRDRERDRERKAAEVEAVQAEAVRLVHALAAEAVPGGRLSWADLSSRSPVPVGSPADPTQQRRNAAALLRRLHPDPSALVWCGPRFGGAECLASVGDWCRRFEQFQPPPYHIANPMTGAGVADAGGVLSFRCDAAVSAPRHALFEIDLPQIPLDVQAAFLLRCVRSGWPIVSITSSGGKSLHALLRVGCADLGEWQAVVRQTLFPVWARFGADPQCRNPSRLTRLPGHVRDGRADKLQSLLWLAG